MIGTEGWVAICVSGLILGFLYFLHAYDRRSRSLGASSLIGEGKLGSPFLEEP